MACRGSPRRLRPCRDWMCLVRSGSSSRTVVVYVCGGRRSSRARRARPSRARRRTKRSARAEATPSTAHARRSCPTPATSPQHRARRLCPRCCRWWPKTIEPHRRRSNRTMSVVRLTLICRAARAVPRAPTIPGPAPSLVPHHPWPRRSVVLTSPGPLFRVLTIPGPTVPACSPALVPNLCLWQAGGMAGQSLSALSASGGCLSSMALPPSGIPFPSSQPHGSGGATPRSLEHFLEPQASTARTDGTQPPHTDGTPPPHPDGTHPPHPDGTHPPHTPITAHSSSHCTPRAHTTAAATLRA
jgi:hypothetical protein